MTRRRVTTPPPVLPLCGIGLLALVVVALAVDAASGVVLLGSLALGREPLDGDDVTPAWVVVRLTITAGLCAAASLLLRRLVARWVTGQPPDAPAP